MKLLTAAEARTRTEESSVTINRKLETDIAPKIAEACGRGERFCSVHLGAVPASYRQFEPDMLTKAVMQALSALGYNVKIEHTGDEYVPRGNSQGTKHQNVSMTIRW